MKRKVCKNLKLITFFHTRTLIRNQLFNNHVALVNVDCSKFSVNLSRNRISIQIVCDKLNSKYSSYRINGGGCTIVCEASISKHYLSKRGGDWHLLLCDVINNYKKFLFSGATTLIFKCCRSEMRNHTKLSVRPYLHANKSPQHIRLRVRKTWYSLAGLRITNTYQ